jgi:hypothetical protein
VQSIRRSAIGRSAINQKKSTGRSSMQSEESMGKSAINQKCNREKCNAIRGTTERSAINEKKCNRKKCNAIKRIRKRNQRRETDIPIQTNLLKPNRTKSIGTKQNQIKQI